MPIRYAAVTPSATRLVMPHIGFARPHQDLVAIGANLAPDTLLSAYRTGLFPMPVNPYQRGSEIAWYSPDPRGIMPLDGMRLSRSLRRSIRRYQTEFGVDFDAVINACADEDRPDRWITPDFIDAYRRLKSLGWAHSVAVYCDDHLVGGLYGLRIGGFFAGESMFHRATDASKVALVHLVDWLRETDASLLDVQWSTPHLASLGVIEVSRDDYLRRLATAIE